MRKARNKRPVYWSKQFSPAYTLLLWGVLFLSGALYGRQAINVIFELTAGFRPIAECKVEIIQQPFFIAEPPE